MSEATIKYVSESLGAGNIKQAEKYLQNTFAFNICIGFLGALAIASASSFMVTNVFNIAPESRSLAQECLLYTALIWFLRQVWQTYVGAITARQQYGIVNLGNLLSQALNASAGIAVLLLGGDLLAFTQAQAGAAAVQTFGWMIAAFGLFPDARIIPRIDRHSLEKTVGFGVWQMLNTVSGIIAGQSQRWILGILLPVATVGYYSVGMQLNTIAYIVSFRIGQVMFPAISQLQGAGEQRTAGELTLRMSWLVSSVAIAGLVPIVAFVPDILALWISPVFATQASRVSQILAIASTIGSLFAIPNFYLLGTGRARWLALVGIGQGILNFVGASLLIPRWGLSGAGWAYVLSTMAHLVGLGLLWPKVLKPWVPLRIYLSTFSPALVGIALGIGAVFARAYWPPITDWWTLLACTAASAVASLLVLFAAGVLLPGGSERGKLVTQILDTLRQRAL